MDNLLRDELLRSYGTYCSNKEADNFEEYQLLGAAKYAKSIAYKLEDLDLLGLASKIEIELLERIKTENEYYLSFDEAPSEFPHLEDGREFCKDLFYKQKRYRVDMKPYRRLLFDHEETFMSAGLYDSLVKYLDEDAVLHKIYNQVKHKIMYYQGATLPEINKVDALFNEAFEDICRKADKHLERQLSKAVATNS
ncbi:MULTISPECIES: hypothetical protein [unclassified Vibrio]|uniref:hypothetical protein n=1 Tax=unclassified Vibrio TaxID=2614977 RepID=UPI002552919C|nr:MULTISPECIES: hypothetical protein [unclassified Vibrio]MDK9779137.1 hypothetical protein [Vibrio sp. D401a]MDK9808109.1 hypothetical protein [Vibrio sp. D406a]